MVRINEIRTEAITPHAIVVIHHQRPRIIRPQAGQANALLEQLWPQSRHVSSDILRVRLKQFSFYFLWERPIFLRERLTFGRVLLREFLAIPLPVSDLREVAAGNNAQV